ncbi:PEP-CTERM sorting domain-containing protein [Luteolibacter sp. SL250]|uniref:PEP-CTERM sorting domain-containing protein n=1 Tax=Luteolibacter sp. SL250 TaxID=2995170 RepID=UPI0022706BB4|nr:PEP-CTERM sorting domain-containing protein [Luteolibacter sp. SL250]WAC20518.1 PEP-CTERM sorting domain-containing protein [Luteolibacter sp. SL250]
MHPPRFIVLMPSCLLALSGLAPGVVLISDSFDNLASGAGLDGRTPETSVAGGNWIAPGTGAGLQGDGAGGIILDYSSGSSAGFDLGSSYITSNPGIYDIRLTVTHPVFNNQSWAALAFSTTLNTASTPSGNGRPWIYYRQNGNISVSANATSTIPANNIGAGTTGATTGAPHTLRLVLDATIPTALTFRAFVDSYEFDLNGATAGNTYTYGTSTVPRYVLFSMGFPDAGSASSQTSSVGQFELHFTPVPEPSAVLLAAAGACFLSRRRRRC